MTAYPAPIASVLKHTPLHALHLEMGARMAPFAGYDMPIQYALGVLKEHLHTRVAAGLFDVSHMGQVDCARAPARSPTLRRLLSALCRSMYSAFDSETRYAFFTNDSGGIIDDLMIGQCGDHLALIVNATRKDVDERHLRDALSDVCTVEVLADRALLALQGPVAETALARLVPSCAAMRFMDIRPVLIAGANCLVSRSGYTGEDGFEISVPARDAEKLARTLLEDVAVKLIGLGARDSLRTEAGLCLYGSDIDEARRPLKLRWNGQYREFAAAVVRARATSRSRRRAGAARGRCLEAPRRAKATHAHARACRCLVVRRCFRNLFSRYSYVRYLRPLDGGPGRHWISTEHIIGVANSDVCGRARQPAASRGNGTTVRSASI